MAKGNNIQHGGSQDQHNKKEENRKQNKVKPNTLMVFAFVLILFGFY